VEDMNTTGVIKSSMLEMVHDSLWQNNKNQVHLKVWEYDGTMFFICN
jgi:hypothetical protein